MSITINGTTGIAGVDGSAATPAVQGVDTNTGVFYPAADTVGVATGGTEQVRVASAGQIGIGGANYGTSGQVLTSGGAAAAPSWTTVSTTGRLLQAPQILTSGTSYTTPANCTAIYVEALGGGGGGARGAGLPGSGGGGGYVKKYFTVSPSTPYTYAIGAGGASRTSDGTGNSGGNTTLTVGATTITAGGGTGGINNSANTSTGGTATNGDINVPGQNSVSAASAGVTAGGDSIYGSGGSATTQNAGGFGAGGAGLTSGTTGAGSAGIIIISEYS